MKVVLREYECVITREKGDPKIYNGVWGDSRLLYLVKKELIKQGYDVVKKLMYKDGHLVSSDVYYIRERKGKFAIWDDQYAIRFTYEPYNKDGRVVLVVNKRLERRVMSEDMILVTNYDEVDKDDFYLSDDWLSRIGSKAEQRRLKRMAKEGNLYDAWVVSALSYAIYGQMDAHHIFIDEGGDEVLSCESDIIGDEHREKWEYHY